MAQTGLELCLILVMHFLRWKETSPQVLLLAVVAQAIF